MRAGAGFCLTRRSLLDPLSLQMASFTLTHVLFIYDAWCDNKLWIETRPLFLSSVVEKRWLECSESAIARKILTSWVYGKCMWYEFIQTGNEKPGGWVEKLERSPINNNKKSYRKWKKNEFVLHVRRIYQNKLAWKKCWAM